MEYFENGRSIGILPFNSNKPDKSLIKKKYKFYSNSSINQGPGMLWIRFESIYNTKTQIGISANLQNTKKYFLIKIVADEKEGELFWTKLFTLQKSDTSIVKIDKSNKVYSFKLQRDFEQEKPVIFTIIGEHIEELEFFENQNGKRVKVKEMRWTGTCGGEFPIFFK
ncbi:MAG: hypothetical protein JNL63_06070 [Bacteroidia bacterium]|nr:hypothetical protein [Bacteroidia bacterium]